MVASFLPTVETEYPRAQKWYFEIPPLRPPLSKTALPDAFPWLMFASCALESLTYGSLR